MRELYRQILLHSPARGFSVSVIEGDTFTKIVGFNFSITKSTKQFYSSRLVSGTLLPVDLEREERCISFVSKDHTLFVSGEHKWFERVERAFNLILETIECLK